MILSLMVWVYAALQLSNSVTLFSQTSCMITWICLSTSGCMWCIRCTEQNFTAVEVFYISGAQHTSQRAIKHLCGLKGCVWRAVRVRQPGLPVMPSWSSHKRMRTKWWHFHTPCAESFLRGVHRKAVLTLSKLWAKQDSPLPWLLTASYPEQA